MFQAASFSERQQGVVILTRDSLHGLHEATGRRLDGVCLLFTRVCSAGGTYEFGLVSFFEFQALHTGIPEP